MPDSIQRTKTAQEWADSDDVLPAGLAGYESDGMGRHKYGDGVSVWSALPWPSGNVPDSHELVFATPGGELVDAEGNPVSSGGGSGGLRLATPEDSTNFFVYGVLVRNSDGSSLANGGINVIPAPGQPNALTTSTDKAGLYQIAISVASSLSVANLSLSADVQLGDREYTFGLGDGQSRGINTVGLLEPNTLLYSQWYGDVAQYFADNPGDPEDYDNNPRGTLYINLVCRPIIL